MFARTRPVAAAAIGLLVAACGGESPTSSPAAPVAVATVAPTPTPTPEPTPTPAPTEAPRRNAPGPVDHVSIKVHAIREADGVNFRQPLEVDGAWILYVGEIAIIDATAKNAEERACDSDGPPEWNTDETRDTVRRVRSPNPFLLWLEAVGTGSVGVSATIDGKGGNGVFIEVRSRQD